MKKETYKKYDEFDPSCKKMLLGMTPKEAKLVCDWLNARFSED